MVTVKVCPKKNYRKNYNNERRLLITQHSVDVYALRPKTKPKPKAVGNAGKVKATKRKLKRSEIKSLAQQC